MFAYHEAGHAVAMWVLGLGVKTVSIEPKGELSGYAEPALEYGDPPHDDLYARRFIVEQNVLYLHAGDVAARLFRPSVGLGQASTDHRSVHQWMYSVEDSGTIQITWCNHLWQRAYDLLHWPGNWFLVIGLAQQLLQHRTLHEAEATRYLHLATARLEYDPWMPNAVLVGEVMRVCSPWHRKWYEEAIAAEQKPKRTDMPTTIADLSARADVRPITWALNPLSTRARNLLRRCGVRAVVDLEDWNEWSLGCVRGGGTKTVAEILDAAARAGVRMGPPTHQFPHELNPHRWPTRI
ncbi:MAG: hypothetical protein ABI779_10075 [Acidobacteriota bacterium]